MQQNEEYRRLHKRIYQQELDKLTKEEEREILDNPNSVAADGFNQHVMLLVSGELHLRERASEISA